MNAIAFLTIALAVLAQAHPPSSHELSAASRPGMLMHGFDFVYQPIDLRSPEGVDAAECIQ